MPTVLILEDDLLLADDWRMLLERAGHEVLHAQTATEAAQILRRAAIDLVLADIFVEVAGQLTPDGGITLLGMSIQERLEGRHPPPVVAVSGAPTSGPYATRVLDLARSMGAVETLSKPVPPEDLLACVTRHVPARAERTVG
jgi:two-component system, NtrC family, response regulator HydG